MFENLFCIHALACNLIYSDCVTHKKKLCHECHFNKLCEKSGKKECQVLKIDEFEELVAKSMEEVDEKVQEAIDSITAHGKRIKNILKNDPVNNKIDENWKLNFQSKEMLVQEKKEVSKTEKKQRMSQRLSKRTSQKLASQKMSLRKSPKKKQSVKSKVIHLKRNQNKFKNLQLRRKPIIRK